MLTNSCRAAPPYKCAAGLAFFCPPGEKDSATEPGSPGEEPYELLVTPLWDHPADSGDSYSWPFALGDFLIELFRRFTVRRKGSYVWSEGTLFWFSMLLVLQGIECFVVLNRNCFKSIDDGKSRIVLSRYSTIHCET